MENNSGLGVFLSGHPGKFRAPGRPGTSNFW